MLRHAAKIVGITLVSLLAGAAFSQDFPTKPIRIVTAAAGGSNDFISRLMSQAISPSLGQPVIVENRTGGIVAATLVSQALPDGYTLLQQSNSVWIGPLLQKVAYDPAVDLAAVVGLAKAPNILTLHPGVAATSVKELIALAKAKPGELNYASGGTGGGSHLSGELFKYLAGVNIVRIAYKGGAAGALDLLAGRVQLTFDDAATLMPHIKLGKLKALAVTSSDPSALAPGLPTMVAAGVPGYIFESTQGVWAPAKTPAAIIRRINQELVRQVHQPEIKEKLFNAGLEPVGNAPEQFGAMIKSDMANMGKMIRAAGIRAD